MTTLKKLLINGVRNFNPEDGNQLIKFSAPLTLFIGQNGCGKTTIIECLKYACSGELPGCSDRGQGFLYDPKLNGELVTCAQIRLRIRTEKGDTYTISKSMNVTVRNNNLTFKKVDHSLKLQKVGEKDEQMVSGRCVDVDVFFTETFGVSKSIINNVIFCHQEDSLWPLDEGSKLKKKFDEIFEVTKYHKCADHIRKKIKESEHRIDVMKNDLFRLEDKNKECESKQISLVEKEERYAKYATEIMEKEEKLEPIMARIREICELQKHLTHFHEEKSAKLSEKKMIMQHIDKLLKNLKGYEFKGSEDELNNEIQNFDRYRHEIDDKLTSLSKKKSEIDMQEHTNTQKKSKLLAELGKLQQEKKNHLEKIMKRKELLQQMENLLKVNIINGQNEDDADVTNASNIIKNAIERLRTSLKQLFVEINENETLLQNTIDECRDKCNKVKHDIESKNGQISENIKKLREKKNQLQELSFSDDQLATLTNKIASVEKELQSVKEKFETQNVSQFSIDKEKSTIKNLEEKLEQLDEEMKIMLKNSITEADMERRLFDMKKQENELIKLKNKHHDNFEIIFSNEIPQRNLKIAVGEIRTSNSKKVAEITRKINQQQNMLTRKEAQLKFAQQKLQAFEDEMISCREKLAAVCKDQTYERTKAYVTMATEKLRKDKGQFSSAKILYEKFIEEFENDKCCPLCRSQFDNKEQVMAEIVSDLKQKIKEIPMRLKKVEDDLKQKESELDKITELASVNGKIKELSEKQIPLASFEVDELTDVCEQLRVELETLKNDLERPQQLELVCNEVLPDATLMDQINLEIVSLKSAIENLHLQIIKTDSNRTKQETETEIENVKMELGNSRRVYENAIKKIQLYNNRCQELRESKSEFIQQQLNIQKQIQGKPQLEQQLIDISTETDQLKSEIRSLEESLPALQNDLTRAEKVQQEEKIKNKEKVATVQDSLYENEKLFENIEKLTIEINEYVNKNKDAIFEKMLDSSAKLEDLLQNLKTTKSEIADEINDLNTKRCNLELKFRNLTDNLDLIDKRKRHSSLDQEIEELSQKIGDFDEKTLFDEKLKLERSGGRINQEINNCKGKSDELKNSIDDLKAELDKPDLKLAKLNYRYKLYEVGIEEQIVEDLKQFLVGFEFSIMHFHQERMEEINKTIKDYWHLIYKGNDIDYIEIKTEQDGKSTSKRRVYNYKVVQVKNDIMMEMRGRCSAGQKVLASIIIRLALAETFSRKCGILALDEPTTNLDRTNINGLCEALITLVETKADEKNFQLLIITHDEEFMNALTAIDKVEFINRVERNKDGHSTIKIEHL
ncbi:DNA repair protein RAD50 isoform X2 [Agrilus planipennis]|nr:DNA repair protein RAD50 isoform X2 [Agrilus planipennis]